MRPIVVTVAGPLQSNTTNNIRTASSISAAGAVTLNGSLVTAGVALLAVAQTVTVTNGSTETIRLTFNGTTFGGAPVSETIQLGAAATTALGNSFLTITGVTSSGASVGNISIGTNGTAVSAWVRFDDWTVGLVSIQCTASGTVNYTVQTTMDDPNSPTNPLTPSAVTWVSSSDTNVVGATGTKSSDFNYAPTFSRVLLNSGTGSVVSTFTQSGSPPQ